MVSSDLLGEAAYSAYAGLRDMLLNLVNHCKCTDISHKIPSLQVDALSRTSEKSSLSFREFERYLTIAHYLAARSACMSVPQLDGIVAKLSISLLRHTDIVPADKAFFEAGKHCRVRPSANVVTRTLHAWLLSYRLLVMKAWLSSFTIVSWISAR